HSWQTTEPTSAGCHAGAGLALEFVDDVHGWIASWDPVAQDHGTLLRTSDGGVTWVALSSPQQGPVTFIDRRRGWSSPGDGLSRNEVCETSDGGLTWRRREIGIGGPGEEPAFGRPRFFDGRTGVMPVPIVHGDTVDVVFLVTGDGGENWRQRGRLATGATAGPPHGVGEVSVAAVSPSMW